ncbi:MAG: hypothetical protein Q8N42_02215 [bacterium]|nr:hypothetical protein [bacterium]
MEDAFRVAEKLNEDGLEAIINFLGEEVKDRTQVRDNVNIYTAVIRRIYHQKLRARISVKPSQLGLKINPRFYWLQLWQVGRSAFLFNVSLEIDMGTEDTVAETVQGTIALAKNFSGLDLRQTMAMNFKDSFVHLYNLTAAGVKVRLSKGAYSSKYSEKNIAGKFYSATSWLLRMKADQDIATHDLGLLYLIRTLRERLYKSLGSDDAVPPDPSVQELIPCGFQFFLGLRKRTWKKLVKEGERVAVCVPFGSNWLPYAKRRWKYVIKKIPSMIMDEIAGK